jgi:hypothetical protein
MPNHARPRSWHPRWALLAACASACVGTPTPEPPDYAPELLPTPDGGLIFATDARIEVATLNDPPSAPLSGQRDAVVPDSRVWIVNLDDLTSLPLEVRARANGSFSAMVQARPGDRLRIVSRTDTRHSLPLDAEFVEAEPGMVRIVALPPTELPCLQVSPPREIVRTLEPGQSLEERFELRNRCSEPVQIEDARLRFGDQGFSLADAPETIAPNQRASLTVSLDGHADATERADIVLLDVRSGGERGRYALGVWSVSATGSGND